MVGKSRICEICGVREKRRGGFFANFPLDESRCKKWVKIVGKEDLVHIPIEKLNQVRHICGDHFVQKDFNRKGSRLKKTAIPSVHLLAPPLTEDQMRDFPLHVASYKVSHAVPSSSVSRMVAVPSANMQGQTVRKTGQADIVSSPVPSTSVLQTVAVPSTSVSCMMDVPSTSARRQTVTQSEQTNIVSSPVPSTSVSCIMDVPSTSARRQTVTQSEQTNIVSSPVPSTSVLRTVAVPSTSVSCMMDVPSTSARRKTVTQSEQTNIELTPRKKKLIRQLNKTRCTLQSLRRTANIVEKIESPVLKEMVINAAKNQGRKPKGRRWTIQNKIAALAIFKRSPKTYRYLNQIIPLPSEKSLQNVLKKIPVKPGINKAVLNHLKSIREKKNLKDRLCCLLFDEMAIKPRLIYNVANDIIEGFEDFGEDLERTNQLADHALVFMLQGLRHKFKQPIAYYFVKGTISSQKLAGLIKDIIKEVSSTGYKIIATVCDQGPTNRGALKLLRDLSGPVDDCANNYFMTGDEKIFIVYDIPHLFKSIRNNFLKHGSIVLNGKQALWSHIAEVEEKNRNLLYLSKISPIHVDPKYRAKMKVKYAAQILSNTVAAVLKLMAEYEKSTSIQRSNALLQSALVIEQLDRLFDATNGPSCPEDVKKGQRQNVSSKTKHMEVWADWIKKLATVKFLNKNGTEARNIQCIEGYKTSIKSLRDIWSYLEKKKSFKYLNLRQLNQDALENLFGVIRQHSPTNRNPTCSHFVAALKTGIVTNLSAYHSRGSNCMNDHKELLTDFQNLVFGNAPDSSAEISHTSSLELDNTAEENTDENFPILSIPDEDMAVETDLASISEQPIVYISGYLASRILKVFDCQSCRAKLTVDYPTLDIYDYIKFREWWPDKHSLTYPSIELCRVVQKAVAVTEEELLSNLYKPNICQFAVTLFYAKCDTNWFVCEIHNINVLKMLFCRLALLLIRRQCQRRNQCIALEEEATADAYKKAQQMGIAK